MRVLLLADLHYRLKQLDWAVEAAGDFDLVVVAGDCLDIASSVPIDAQIAVTLRYLARIARRAPIVVSSGNHDLNGTNAAGERAAVWTAKLRRLGIPTDGESTTLGDALVTICPWWEGERTREAIGEQLARDAARRPRRWIWVHHGPPSGSPTAWNGTRSFGDDALAHWIGQLEPDLVLCGHIHQAPFRAGGSWIDRIGRSSVLNGGSQIGPVPSHVILDLDAATATWSSLAGVERARLDAEAALRELVSEHPALQSFGSGSRAEPRTPEAA